MSIVIDISKLPGAKSPSTPLNVGATENESPRGFQGFTVDATKPASYYLDKPQLISDLKLNDFTFHTAIMIVSGRKVVKQTVLAGLDHPVNEVIANGGYEVKFAGPLIGADGFPVVELQALIDLYNENKAVKVQCEYLRLFSIDQIVITDINFPDASGFDNVSFFEFSALSDTPVELELSNGIFS